MTRNVPLLLLLLSSAVHAQAVAPPPRPPAVRTVVNAPTFATPGATPAGAGITFTEPGGSFVTVLRSPNKRLLPPAKEAGLWAADGAKASLAPPPIYGVELPYAANATTQEKRATYACAATMSQAAVASGANAVAGAYPLHERQCLSAHAYEYCADGMLKRYANLRKMGEHYDPEEVTALEAAKKHAAALVATYCSEISVANEKLNTHTRTTRLWDTTMDRSMRP